MRVLDRTRRALDLAEWRNRSPAESDYDELIHGSFQVWEHGELVLAYLDLADDAWAAPYLDPIAAVLPRVHFLASERSEGLKTVSRIFGYRPRVPMRHDYCSAASLAGEQPAEHAVIAAGARVVARYYAAYHPRLAARHQRLAESRVLPDWRMEGSLFTSGIVNQNNPLKYHFDRGNFRGVWSGMLGFKHAIAGGYLALPEFGIAAEIADRSLFLFDGQGILHGVTPIRRLAPDALRHTIVYYSLQGMWECEPLGSELDRLRLLRTSYETRRGHEPAPGSAPERHEAAREVASPPEVV